MQYLGLIAGLFTTFSLVPQIIRVIRLRSAREISILFTGAQLIGMLLWLTYGIKLGLTPIILWNSIATLLIIMLLYVKLRYGRWGLK